jgi:hypothetical protein
MLRVDAARESDSFTQKTREGPFDVRRMGPVGAAVVGGGGKDGDRRRVRRAKAIRAPHRTFEGTEEAKTGAM